MVRKKDEGGAATASSGKAPSSSSSSSKKAGSKKEGAGEGKKKEKVSLSPLLPPEPDLVPAKPAAAKAPKLAKPRGSRLPPPAPESNYLAGVDLPPSDDEPEEVQRVKRPVRAAAAAASEGDDDDDDDDDDDESDESEEERERAERRRLRGSGVVHLGMQLQVSDRELRKREKREALHSVAHEQAKKEALLEDDANAFSVTLGAKSAVLEGDDIVDANARDVKIENFSVSARGKELFRNASITIVHGRRYGLVGPNGKGKSTIMKLLARRQLPVPKNIDVLLVEQEVVGDSTPALEAVVSADKEVMELRAEEVRLRGLAEREGEEAEVATLGVEHGGPNGASGGASAVALPNNGSSIEGQVGEDNEDELDLEDGETGDRHPRERRAEARKSKKGAKNVSKKGLENGKQLTPTLGGSEDQPEVALTAGEQLAAVYERMQVIGAEAAEARASKILAGLGFSKDMQGRPTKSFSGGWRMRISLARALYVQPTLLLLDEPTNHLDLRAVLWLEEYLMRWKKTLVVVSHDRDFLNAICTDIIHLHDEKLHFYKGNFETFEEMYEQKRRENNKKSELYEKQIKAAKKTGSKACQDKVKDRAKMQAAKEAKGKGKGKGAAAADEEDAPVEAPRRWRDYAVEFHFPEPTELTPPLLQLRDVTFKYPSREDFGLTEIDVGVDMGTRVAIVGPNGAGKSTLLNLLAGDLQPTTGESRQSQKLRIGRYSQHFVDLLAFDETPVAYLLRLYPEQEGPSKQEAVRAKLGKFGLPSHNHLTPIVKLSGGQKARVVFTSISMARPHILLLDEPTNHLDMQSIDALADALDEFTGGVVLVSHDSRLISRVCENEETSEIWLVENGTCERYDGSFEEYKQELVKEIIAEVEE